jgi:hypothetical protein
VRAVRARVGVCMYVGVCVLSFISILYVVRDAYAWGM